MSIVLQKLMNYLLNLMHVRGLIFPLGWMADPALSRSKNIAKDKFVLPEKLTRILSFELHELLYSA